MQSFLCRYFQIYYKHIYQTRLLKSVPARNYSENGRSHNVLFKTFNDVLSFRRSQAEKSVLIGVNSDTHIEDVLKICERFGMPTTKIVFRPGNFSEYQLVCLVEYQSVEEVQGLLGSCSHVVRNGCSPVHSRLLCHHHSSRGSRGSLSLQQLQAQGLIHHSPSPTEEETSRDLSSCQNAAEQMERLHTQECLPDLGFRLRFLLCRQVEDSLMGFLPCYQALPFGSSINGFGAYNCDLDISLHFNQSLGGSGEGLMFQSPWRQMANERARTQVTLEVLGDLIQNLFPCVSSVQRILRARVPILKIHHTITGLDCDLSLSNSTGLYMSELLFVLGEVDARVRPLVFAVRKWARNIQLTRDASGHWVTNFSLTLMVLFFLMTRRPAVLPTLQQLRDLAGPEDVRTADGVDCTFKRNFTQISKSENTEDLGSLLVDFFWFCSNMKWDANAISLVSGEIVKKPDASALFVENPLEPHLNVCSIVINREVEKFLSAVKDVLWELESNPKGQEPFKFLLGKSATSQRSRMRKGLVVSQLFEQSNKGPASGQRSSPMEPVLKNRAIEKVDKTSRPFSRDLNDELVKLQVSRRSKKRSPGKSSQKPNKLFSSADLWKLL